MKEDTALGAYAVGRTGRYIGTLRPHAKRCLVRTRTRTPKTNVSDSVEDSGFDLSCMSKALACLCR
jgi:hypothetical protein